MHWVHSYQLFLFDFDGILVNTEELHYKAYQKMCAQRGFSLNWDWKTYMGAAMYDSNGLKEAIYAAFPDLYRQEPKWEVLYKEKKSLYESLLEAGEVRLMPGVEKLLRKLQDSKIKRCVVTHSSVAQTELLRKQLPLLNTIPYWVTREDYMYPKPHPECYQKAVSLFAAPKDSIIGFEDSPRGLRALLEADLKGILINPLFNKSELSALSAKPFKHFSSFDELCATEGDI